MIVTRHPLRHFGRRRIASDLARWHSRLVWVDCRDGCICLAGRLALLTERSKRRVPNSSARRARRDFDRAMPFSGEGPIRFSAKRFFPGCEMFWANKVPGQWRHPLPPMAPAGHSMQPFGYPALPF